MKTATDIRALATAFLDAWNSQEVPRVLACYTDDLVYRDPNTRGDVRGAEAMGRYLARLFAEWKMTWALREAYPLAGEDGAAVLWSATFARQGQSRGESRIVTADGMDLVLLSGDRIRRNDVYFDRTVLAPRR